MSTYSKVPALVDVAVLLVFFIRKDKLQQVFDRIHEARPSKLFLYQDGPRTDHPNDAEALVACRAVVESIDWECEVHHLYQEKNYGPDESGYRAATWAFSHADKCIVLEDDIVPSVSLFSFCKVLLDKYENDERVYLISAQNFEKETKGIAADYFFSYTTFLSGSWASWSRVVKQWDASYSFLDNTATVKSLNEHLKKIRTPWNYEKTLRYHRSCGIPRFESILIANQHIHRGLTIVPTRNMAANVGLGGDSAHYTTELHCMARGDRQMFGLPTYEVGIQHIKHPEEVREYPAYQDTVYRIRAWGHPFVKSFRCLESFFLQIMHGHSTDAFKTLKRQVCGVIYRMLH